MTVFYVPALRNAADQLNGLLQFMSLPQEAITPQQLRKADKNLINLEAFFNDELTKNALEWAKNHRAESILQERINLITLHHERLDQLQSKINNLQDMLAPWKQLSIEHSQKILKQGNLAKNYLSERTYNTEAHILHKYNTYNELRALLPYADKADYLCEALEHYQNHEKYEQNIQKLEYKKTDAITRLNTVKKGYILAIILCLCIVTLPICIPFAFSLWNRMKKIHKQIANTQDAIRREERRLQLANEGTIASHEISKILGDVSLDQIRNTLVQLRELRQEFQNSKNSPTITGTLLTFLEIHLDSLKELFGNPPEEPLQMLQWLSKKTEEYKIAELQLKNAENEKETITTEIKNATSGYSIDILQKNQKYLCARQEEILPTFCDSKIMEEFVQVCTGMPLHLNQIRMALARMSNGQGVASNHWLKLHLLTRSYANILSVCIMETEIIKFQKNPMRLSV